MYVRVKVSRLGQVESVASRYIADCDATQTVGSLIPHLIDASDNVDNLDITCISCGELIPLSKTLGGCDIDTFSVLQFVIKPKIVTRSIEDVPPNLSKVSQAMVNLHWIIRKGVLHELTRMMSRQEWIERAASFFPELAQNSVAYSIIQDSKLLNVLLRDQSIVDKLVALYPCILPVLCMAISEFCGTQVESRGKPVGRLCASHSHNLQDYTIDQNLEDDTGVGVDSNGSALSADVMSQAPSRSASSEPNPPSGAVQRSGPPSRLGRQQLHSAIVQAQEILGGGIPTFSEPGRVNATNNTPRCETTDSITHRITPQALSQALASAAPPNSNQTRPVSSQHNDGTTSSTVDPVSSENRWAHQLAQLAEMGICDEAVATQALEATNGDLALAVQLLFG